MALTENDLHQFTGTDVWYRHGINRKVTYTEGVRYLAVNGGAYWLVDMIAIQNMGALHTEPFQVWKLRKDVVGSGATIFVEDGNGNVSYKQSIPYTDFPLDTVDLYFTDDVILLPSEY